MGYKLITMKHRQTVHGHKPHHSVPDALSAWPAFPQAPLARGLAQRGRGHLEGAQEGAALKAGWTWTGARRQARGSESGKQQVHLASEQPHCTVPQTRDAGAVQAQLTNAAGERLSPTW